MQLLKRYFGTDGIRGTFGQAPILEDFFSKLAIAVEIFFCKKLKKDFLKICIGRDTRASGGALFKALTEGFSQHSTILDCEILPTPAIAEITVSQKCDIGIAITASHNPASDNGIKFFNSFGEKLTIAEEEKIEEILKNLSIDKPLTSRKTVINFHKEAQTLYIKKYENSLPSDALKGKTIALDSANGATYDLSKKIFENFGAKIIQIGNTPNGNNINENCGSEHTANLRNLIIESHASLGIANDGDGDRVVILDENGEKLHGDVLIATIAKHMLQKNNLPNNSIVVTNQSNLGLDLFLKKCGIKVIRCDVGDRNVYQSMLQNNCFFGGENSGHLIFRQFSKIGDGITAAILFLALLVENNKNVSNLKTNIDLFPQKSFNVIVREKKNLNEIGHLQEDVRKIESELPKPGRVMIRYSGTEPKLRVLVESPDEMSTDHAWKNLQQSIYENMDKDDIYALIA